MALIGLITFLAAMWAAQSKIIWTNGSKLAWLLLMTVGYTTGIAGLTLSAWRGAELVANIGFLLFSVAIFALVVLRNALTTSKAVKVWAAVAVLGAMVCFVGTTFKVVMWVGAL